MFASGTFSASTAVFAFELEEASAEGGVILFDDAAEVVTELVPTVDDVEALAPHAQNATASTTPIAVLIRGRGAFEREFNIGEVASG